MAKKGMNVSMPVVLLLVFVGGLFLYSFKEGQTNMRKNKPGTVPAESVASSPIADMAATANMELREPRHPAN